MESRYELKSSYLNAILFCDIMPSSTNEDLSSLSESFGNTYCYGWPFIAAFPDLALAAALVFPLPDDLARSPTCAYLESLIEVNTFFGDAVLLPFWRATFPTVIYSSITLAALSSNVRS